MCRKDHDFLYQIPFTLNMSDGIGEGSFHDPHTFLTPLSETKLRFLSLWYCLWAKYFLQVY